MFDKLTVNFTPTLHYKAAATVCRSRIAARLARAFREKHDVRRY